MLLALREQMPELVYLIMGDDRERLLQKAKTLGVEDIVVFTGYVSEEEKADHYRLADVFAMPGSIKHFDRYPFRCVFLEALACGVPVVGCLLEDDSEANDPDAKRLIIQVDPNNQDDIKQGIVNALESYKDLRTGIDDFYFPAFKDKAHSIVDDVIGSAGSKSH